MPLESFQPREAEIRVFPTSVSVPITKIPLDKIDYPINKLI
jgi:hypothetical protein